MGGGIAAPGDDTTWTSADVDSNSSPIRSYGYVSPSKVNSKKSHNSSDAAIISEIDCMMTRQTDKLLQAIDGLRACLSQLESRTHQLELSVYDLKISVGNNSWSTDGTMRQTKNILLEVQSCVQDMKCKQEIMSAVVEPTKLPFSSPAQETQTFAQTNTTQQMTPAPHQVNQQFSFASMEPFPISASPPPPQQSLNQSIQLPTQYPPPPTTAAPQLDIYFPLPSQTQEGPSQHFLTPPSHQQTQTLTPPSGIEEYQFFQLSPPSLYPHHQPVAADNSPVQPPRDRPPQEAHSASQTYPPSFKQFHGLYDSPGEPYSYSGSSSHYGNDLVGKYDSPRSYGSGGYYSNNNNNPQTPTGSAVSGGVGRAGSENSVPIDDVVDRVVSVGFPRESARETVRKMTENEQAIDLNVLLDKLMNGGEVQPPSRAWSRH